MDQSVFNRTGLLSFIFYGDHTGACPYRDLSFDQPVQTAWDLRRLLYGVICCLPPVALGCIYFFIQ